MIKKEAKVIYWVIGIIIVIAMAGTIIENIAGFRIFERFTRKLTLIMGVLAIGSIIH